MRLPYVRKRSEGGGRRLSLFPPATLALLGWGALAFGAEYSWGYAPLLVFAVVVGALGLLASAGMPSSPRLALALVAILIAGLLQLVPVSRPVATPSSVSVDYGQLYARATMRPADTGRPSNPAAPRSISIAPLRTTLGLVFFGALAMLLVGSARGLGVVGAPGIARGIIVLGVIVALVGIAQNSLGDAAVYGFWYPPKIETPSAPFINRNHFSGWMLMAICLAIGSFAGGVARALRGARDWRQRIVWLSSREASETILAGFAIAVMALSIVLLQSRAGLLCLLLAILLLSAWLVRRQPSRRRRLIGVSCLAVVLVAAASCGRVDAVLQRFDGASADIGGRLGIWQDTVRIIRDFPLTGTGLNTYGIAMLHYQTAPGDQLFIEAHNDYLQLVAEGGLLLGVPILMAVILFVREVGRRFKEGADDIRTYWLRTGAVIGLCTIALQETVDFTLQMPGAAVLFVVVAAIAVHVPPRATMIPRVVDDLR